MTHKTSRHERDVPCDTSSPQALHAMRNTTLTHDTVVHKICDKKTVTRHLQYTDGTFRMSETDELPGL
jgi:hypothetical protein